MSEPMNNEARAQMPEELEAVFDGILDVQSVRNGQFNSKARFLKTTYYEQLRDLWEVTPHGEERAEIIAFLSNKINNQSISAATRAKFVTLRTMLEKIPEEEDFNFILVYLQLRATGRKQTLSQEQKTLLGGERSRGVRNMVRTDVYVTFGNRTGSKAEHRTACDLLDSQAQPPHGTYANIAKDVQFAQKLAGDVHCRGKPMVTMESAAPYMRRYHLALASESEGMVEREYRNLVTGADADQEETVTPLKRAWAATGGAVGSALAEAAKKLKFKN